MNKEQIAKLKEFKELRQAATNASFDCGEFDDRDDAEGYRNLALKANSLNESLDSFVESMLTERTTSPVQVDELSTHEVIGKIIDQMSQLQMLWGLNEPGALVRFREVSDVLFAASRAYRPHVAAAAPHAQAPGAPVAEPEPDWRAIAEGHALNATDLGEALRPFAEAYKTELNTLTDDPKLQTFFDRNTITPQVTMGDFRRAHEAYFAASKPYPTRPDCEAEALTPSVEEHPHQWNDDGEKCLRCGASDWMADGCTPPQPVAEQGEITFDRRWSLAQDGFGVERNDESGEYVAHDDAIAVLHAAIAASQPEAKAAPAKAEANWTAEEAADFAANPSGLDESRMSLAARVAGMAIRRSVPDEALMFQIKRLQSLLTKPHRELIERAIQWHEAGREAQEVRRLVPSQVTDAATPWAIQQPQDERAAFEKGTE